MSTFEWITIGGSTLTLMLTVGGVCFAYTRSVAKELDTMADKDWVRDIYARRDEMARFETRLEALEKDVREVKQDTSKILELLTR